MYQTYLAKKLDFSSPQFISNIERSISILPPEKVHSVSKILEIDVDMLSKWGEMAAAKKYRSRVNKA